jgi:hypothetical protein
LTLGRENVGPSGLAWIGRPRLRVEDPLADQVLTKVRNATIDGVLHHRHLVSRHMAVLLLPPLVLGHIPEDRFELTSTRHEILIGGVRDEVPLSTIDDPADRRGQVVGGIAGPHGEPADSLRDPLILL